MLAGQRPWVRGAGARAFDVVCAGEAELNVADERAAPTGRERVRLRAGGGAIATARVLAGHGLRVGLATVLADDRVGRALLARLAASGIDVGGVERATRASGLVLVRGGARQVVACREQEQPISVPEGWSAQVLLLSGMSPVLSHTAALCKAARAARRAGTIVVLDLRATFCQWRGRDPRILRMVLREADVVWCTAQDLFGLNLDVQALRAALRPSAVLVSSDGVARASATGPFGEVARTRANGAAIAPLDEGDAFIASICLELARAGHTDDRGGALWARALERAHGEPTRR